LTKVILDDTIDTNADTDADDIHLNYIPSATDANVQAPHRTFLASEKATAKAKKSAGYR
jgi:hypothetical protein